MTLTSKAITSDRSSKPAAKPALLKRIPIWLVYVVGFLPAAWGFYEGATGRLGADPVKGFEHLLGLWTLRLLILTLLITPIRDLTGVSLLRFRRAIGLLAFYYVCMHLSAYMILDQALNLPAIIADVIKRPFITIGMASFIILVPLAFTSNAWSIRRMGRNWVRLHKLAYFAIAGGAIHYLMSVKSWPAQPVIYAAIIALLLMWRLVGRQFIKRRTRTGTH